MRNVHEMLYGNRRYRTLYYDYHGYNRGLPSASPKDPEEHRPSLNADTVDKERQSQVRDSFGTWTSKYPHTSTTKRSQTHRARYHVLIRCQQGSPTR